MYPRVDQRYRGLGFTVAAGAAAGPAVPGLGAPIGAVVGAITTIFPFIFGAPRGELQKYELVCAPLLTAEAQKLGAPCFICWFNEAVGETPSGERHKLGSYTSMYGCEQLIQKYADVVGKAYLSGYIYQNGNFYYGRSPKVFIGQGTGGSAGGAAGEYISSWSIDPARDEDVIPAQAGVAPAKKDDDGWAVLPWVIIGGSLLFLWSQTSKKG